MKKADAVLCGDIHLRLTTPIARTDDFVAAMWYKIKFINELALQHDCPVLCAGDFFDNWKPTPELLSAVIERLPAHWYTIYGDHDLPQHSYKLRHKSGLTTLKKAGALTIVKGGHGSDKGSNKLKSTDSSIVINGRKVFLWHILTWKDELPYPGCTNSNAMKLLKKYPEFDCIVTGDNHKPFIERYKGRILVNVGSMMRTRADQINYKPAVWLYYADKNDVVPVYLPIEENVISREHIEAKEERDNRIEAFISKVKTNFKLTMSFERNVKRFFNRNKTNQKVKEIILKHLENENIN
jgi:predicted phosphodiesterase